LLQITIVWHTGGNIGGQALRRFPQDGRGQTDGNATLKPD
jgi:hypothetical protein